ADNLFACRIRHSQTRDRTVNFKYRTVVNTGEYEWYVEDCVFVRLVAFAGPGDWGNSSRGGLRRGLKMTVRRIETDRNPLSRDRRRGDNLLQCEDDLPRNKCTEEADRDGGSEDQPGSASGAP